MHTLFKFDPKRTLNIQKWPIIFVLKTSYKLFSKIPIEKTCENPSCNNVFLQTRKDRRFCIKPCRARAKYTPQRDMTKLKGK